MRAFPVDVMRSTRRKSTVSASLRDGRIKVLIPDDLAPEEEARLVERVVDRVTRKATSARIDLATRAAELAARYSLPTPESIVWSERQKSLWGSCTPESRRIRISSRLASMPPWVLDMVLVHELAHLEVAGHGPKFQELVNRYELAERATGYLIAVSGLAADPSDVH